MSSPITKLIPATGYLCVSAEGTYDLGQACEVVRDINAGAEAGTAILLDLRGVTSLLTVNDIVALTSDVAAVGVAAGRSTAVLSPPDLYEDARFFAVTLRSMGYEVQAFTSLEEATDWLTL